MCCTLIRFTSHWYLICFCHCVYVFVCVGVVLLTVIFPLWVCVCVFQTTLPHINTRKSLRHSHTHRGKMIVSFIPNHSNTHTRIRQQHIKYRWGVKQTKVQHTLRKRKDDLYRNPWSTENLSNCKHEWVQVSLNTLLTRLCAIYVIWRKQQTGNMHVCKNKINK